MDSQPNRKLHAVGETETAMLAESPRREGRARSFLRELSQRKVCRTAISYALVLWLNLQIGDVLFPIIGLPEWTLKLVMFAGFMGFPVVLILAWTFQITERGIELDLESERRHGPLADRYLDRVVSLLLLSLSLVLTCLMVVQCLAGH